MCHIFPLNNYIGLVMCVCVHQKQGWIDVLKLMKWESQDDVWDVSTLIMTTQDQLKQKMNINRSLCTSPYFTLIVRTHTHTHKVKGSNPMSFPPSAMCCYDVDLLFVVLTYIRDRCCIFLYFYINIFIWQSVSSSCILIPEFDITNKQKKMWRAYSYFYTHIHTHNMYNKNDKK